MAKPRKTRNPKPVEPGTPAEPHPTKPLTWADLRVAGWTVDVVGNQLVRGGHAGHLCPTSGCKEELVWGQTITLAFSRYMVECRSCHQAWYLSAKHLRAVLRKEKEAACPLSTDTPSASSASDATS